MELTLPSPGTVSPRAAFQMPPGPSKVAVPPTTLRNVQPLIEVGLVSGNGTRLATGFVRPFSAEECDFLDPFLLSVRMGWIFEKSFVWSLANYQFRWLERVGARRSLHRLKRRPK